MTSTIAPWSKDIITTDWTYFWQISATSFRDTAGTATGVSGGLIMAYIGGAFAFLISMIGALLNIA